MTLFIFKDTQVAQNNDKVETKMIYDYVIIGTGLAGLNAAN